MHSIQAKILLLVGTGLEFLGFLTLITNDGTLIPKVDLGFSVSAVLPVEVQRMGFFITGGLTTFYAVVNMK